MTTPQSEFALLLAQAGFHVFPLAGKLPAIKDFPNKATADLTQVRAWFNGTPRNIGISTSHFATDEGLIVIDLDLKNGKRGDLSLMQLELDGFELPPTFAVSTPSGGTHYFYRTPKALRQGVDLLGNGLDVRSLGGYVVGPKSIIDGKEYVVTNKSSIAPAPEWLVQRLGQARATPSTDTKALPNIDPDKASQRAQAYLAAHAPLATEGQGGDETTYKVALHLKDLGCDVDQALDLMSLRWNERCDPPWLEKELETKVHNAFKYGRDPQGVSAPEAIFPPVQDESESEPEAKKHPLAEINSEYAFIKAGAFVLQETTDEDGGFITMRLPVSDFHAWFANRPFAIGNSKPRAISLHWMEWKDRRQYDGVVFSPGKSPGSRWYNLWRGFSVEPAGAAVHPAVEDFKEHAFKNVCNGNEAEFNYLISFFAHMIQKPWEKPTVALVLKGKKGVGKNVIVERVGALLGPHFIVADDDRYLIGNFNSHLESNLFFVLDEAAWAGDKRAEGKLKGLITGTKRMVEHKGKEARNVKSLTRVAIVGNEDWLVPATEDERRYAVFDVGEGRMQDRKFFNDMRKGMESGGYACLLRYLLDFHITCDVNEAPNTRGLINQKLAGLEPVQQWWYDTLATGTIAGGDWAGEWPDTIPSNRLRDALRRWVNNRNIKGRLPYDVQFGKILRQMAPSFEKKKLGGSKVVDGDTSYAYFKVDLEVLRKEFDKYIGGGVSWNE